MVVLGGIFNLRAAPGLYMWMWPFKYLVKYEKNVRARSAEEESKLQDGSEPHVPEVALRSHNESSNIINGEDRQPRYNGVSQSPLLIGADSDESGRESKYQNAQDPTVVRGIEGKVRKEVGREPKFKANQEPKIRSNSVEKTWKDTNEDSTAEKTASKTRQGRQQTTQGEEIVSNPTPLRDELRRIVEFMDNDMKDLFQMQKSIEDGARESIAFDFLWLLFKPGDLVITRGEQTRAYVVLHVTGGRALDRSAQNESPRKNQQNYYVTEETRRETEAYLAKYPKTTPFVLDCFCIDFDGTNFGPLPHKFMLAEYEGEVSITSLEVFPARFAQNFEHTKRALIKRGKRFVKLAKVAHKYYSGKTIREPWILENQGEVRELASSGSRQT